MNMVRTASFVNGCVAITASADTHTSAALARATKVAHRLEVVPCITQTPITQHTRYVRNNGIRDDNAKLSTVRFQTLARSSTELAGLLHRSELGRLCTRQRLRFTSYGSLLRRLEPVACMRGLLHGKTSEQCRTRALEVHSTVRDVWPRADVTEQRILVHTLPYHTEETFELVHGNNIRDSGSTEKECKAVLNRGA